MTYWIFVTNADTWKTVEKEHIWGTDVRTVQNAAKEDKAVVYVMQTKSKKGKEILPPRVKAAYEISSAPYEDHTNIFKGGSYPYRVKLTPEIVLEESYVNFRDLVPNLNFIKNKTVWSGHLRVGINDMPKADYELIKKKLEGKQ